MKLFRAPQAVIVALSFFWVATIPIRADEPTDSHYRLADELGAALTQQISIFIADSHDELIRTLDSQRSEESARLRAEIDDRDARIAELESRIRQLEDFDGVAADELARPGHTFLGITHVAAGAEITAVLPKSPAELSGLQVGDVVTSIDGVAVSSQSLGVKISSYAPRSPIVATIIRDGMSLEIDVTLGDELDLYAGAELPFVPEKCEIAAGDAEDDANEEARPVPAVSRDDSLRLEDSSAERYSFSPLPATSGDAPTEETPTDETTADETTADEIATEPLSARRLYEIPVVRRGLELMQDLIEKAGSLEPATQIDDTGSDDTGSDDTGIQDANGPAVDANPGVDTSGFLGVSVVAIDRGLEVTEVEESSAASRHGLKIGDILQQVDGLDLYQPSDLEDALSGLSAGDEVSLVYERDAETREVESLELEAESGKSPVTTVDPTASIPTEP